MRVVDLSEAYVHGLDEFRGSYGPASLCGVVVVVVVVCVCAWGGGGGGIRRERNCVTSIIMGVSRKNVLGWLSMSFGSRYTV